MPKTDLNKFYEMFPNLPKCITSNQIGGIISKSKPSPPKNMSGEGFEN